MIDSTEPAGFPYRGEDRRQHRSPAAPGGSGERNPLALAACGLLGVALAFVIGPLVAPSSAGAVAFDVEPLFDAAAVAVAVIIGVLCFVRWRLVGQVCSLWLAAALLTYGIATLAVGHLLPVVAEARPPVLMWLHPASRIVFVALLATALVAPEVDARVGPLRVLWRAVAGIAALTVLFQLLPSLGRGLAGARDGIAQQQAMPTGSLVLIAAFAVLGALYLWRGAKASRFTFSWFGLFILALAGAELMRLFAPDDPGIWGAGGSALRLTGLLVAVTGATRDLVSAYGEQGGRLLESVTTGAANEARIRAEQAANEERAHEARNALTAIEGATRTLEHYRDRLDPDTRASLTAAISGEIARLQNLISTTRTKGELEAFSVERALRHVITSTRARGIDLTVEIAPDLQALGRGPETAEVVQNLIENAVRYAPASPIAIRASRDEGGVVVRVEDRGPGVPESERRIIFTRGARGAASPRADGSGLGLYVSMELMHEQSGDLWVEDRPGGGASFALWLPSPLGPKVDGQSDRREPASSVGSMEGSEAAAPSATASEGALRVEQSASAESQRGAES